MHFRNRLMIEVDCVCTFGINTKIIYSYINIYVKITNK